ncbi:GNAT family N-acetyltransferase [Marinivivus vitaminiproducens]|uniref:GNAT family N-acetyltransferase n=1 Tax=Marinivivus vitaminiproducens TaxID=3035935 RepID=UPI0027A3F0D9|nr:GNAT family N-acetyltransferase [Geminicoccaceae bacterium SCSIO 64248]
MDQPVFRLAVADDLDAIVGLLADDAIGSQRETINPKAKRSYETAFEAIQKDPRNSLHVVVIRGRVAGCLQLTFMPCLSNRGGDRAILESVRIASELRGQGIGRRFVRYAVDLAREAGCVQVQLTTDKRRVDAQRFYATLGFTRSHEGFKLMLGPDDRHT